MKLNSKMDLNGLYFLNYLNFEDGDLISKFQTLF